MLSRIVTVARYPRPAGTWEHFMCLKDTVDAMKSASWDSDLGISEWPWSTNFHELYQAGLHSVLHLQEEPFSCRCLGFDIETF